MHSFTHPSIHLSVHPSIHPSGCCFLMSFLFSRVGFLSSSKSRTQGADLDVVLFFSGSMNWTGLQQSAVYHCNPHLWGELSQDLVCLAFLLEKVWNFSVRNEIYRYTVKFANECILLDDMDNTRAGCLQTFVLLSTKSQWQRVGRLRGGRGLNIYIDFMSQKSK